MTIDCQGHLTTAPKALQAWRNAQIAGTTAFMQCLTSDLFSDFPTLKFVIPHGGGAVPCHGGSSAAWRRS